MNLDIFKPNLNQVIVKLREKENKIDGIILADISKKISNIGKVISIGKIDKKIEFKVGDTIIVNNNEEAIDNALIIIKQERFYIVPIESVLAKIKE